RPFILTDTVGFIRKLPHELVAAFRATLEELTEADVLVHVVDASQGALEEHMAAVDSLLRELEVAADRPTVLALNKVDRLDEAHAAAVLAGRRSAVALSAATGEGVETLLDAIEKALPVSGAVTLRIPHGDGGADRRRRRLRGAAPRPFEPPRRLPRSDGRQAAARVVLRDAHVAHCAAVLDRRRGHQP